METLDQKIPLLSQEILDRIPNKFLDIPYCNDSANQILDIYLPSEGNGPFPVIAHFHGGAFIFGTQRDENLEPVLRALDRGYAVVSAQYRMSDEAKFPALIYDAKTVIRFIRAHSDHYNFDSSRIAAWGPSAGGYIVTMLGVTGNNPAFEDLDAGYAEYSSDVQAVVNWCGPCGNFLLMDEDIRINGIGEADHSDPLSPESRLLGNPITEVPELTDLSTPLKYIHNNVPPFIIHHGASDGTVPVQQSIRLANAIRRKVGSRKVVFECFEGKGHHGEPWFDEPWLSDKVFQFLDRVLEVKK
ncbi:MAG TPA: alpha/beta hydrolase [Proteiniclasticum sp.]|nr:alpha/beta hydrolase [Proteiniclasticum sp.]